MCSATESKRNLGGKVVRQKTHRILCGLDPKNKIQAPAFLLCLMVGCEIVGKDEAKPGTHSWTTVDTEKAVILPRPCRPVLLSLKRTIVWGAVGWPRKKFMDERIWDWKALDRKRESSIVSKLRSSRPSFSALLSKCQAGLIC
jgi:hypothetical protein